METMSGKAACLFLQDKKQDVFVLKARMGLFDTYNHADPIKAKRLTSK
jgi:hypothetical protein